MTVGYRPHGAVRQLQAQARQNPLLLRDSGAVRTGRAPRGWKVSQVVMAMPGTWSDRNGNFRFDAGRERRRQSALAVAAERLPEKGQPPQRAGGGRIVVYGDVDVASDLLLRNRGNRIAMAQAMDWLAGPAAQAVYPESEADVRLLHARSDDWLWFYLPVVGFPALVLGAGLWRVRRLRARGERGDG